MTDKTPNSKKQLISNLVSQMPEELLTHMDYEASHPLSDERIKALALEKRQNHIAKEKEPDMNKSRKRTLPKIFLVAAIVCALSITVLASGGLNFFKNLFGGGSEIIEPAVVTPIVYQEIDDISLSVEAMVTDGYVTNLILALKGAHPADEAELFHISSNVDLSSSGWHEMKDFSSKGTTYYNMRLVSLERFETAELKLSLNPDLAPISLDVTLNNQLGNALLQFPSDTTTGTVTLSEM